MALSGLMNSIAGAAGGAGLPRNCDNGSTLYPAWILLTLSMSLGLKSCVRNGTKANSVSDRITDLTPGGASPFQVGPARRNLPASLPVARLPT